MPFASHQLSTSGYRKLYRSYPLPSVITVRKYIKKWNLKPLHEQLWGDESHRSAGYPLQPRIVTRSNVRSRKVNLLRVPDEGADITILCNTVPLPSNCDNDDGWQALKKLNCLQNPLHIALRLYNMLSTALEVTVSNETVWNRIYTSIMRSNRPSNCFLLSFSGKISCLAYTVEHIGPTHQQWGQAARTDGNGQSFYRAYEHLRF